MGPAALGRTGDLPATPSKRLSGPAIFLRRLRSGWMEPVSLSNAVFSGYARIFTKEDRGLAAQQRESQAKRLFTVLPIAEILEPCSASTHISVKNCSLPLGSRDFDHRTTSRKLPPSTRPRRTNGSEKAGRPRGRKGLAGREAGELQGWQAARQPSTPNWLLALWTRNLSGLHGRLTDACRRPKRRNLGHGPLKGSGREHLRHAPEGKWLPSRCYVDADVVMAGRASRAGRCRGRPCFARQGGIAVGHAWCAGRGQGPLKGKERPKAAPLIARQIVVASALRRHVHAGFGVLRTAGLAGCPRAFLWREALFPAGYSAFSAA